MHMKLEVKSADSNHLHCCFLRGLLQVGLTDLPGGNDVLVLWVLVYRQTENVISVFQVETLGSWQDRK